MKRRTPGKLKGKVGIKDNFDAPMRLESDSKWLCEVVDASDGSGDLMLQFPPEMLAETGWTEGTKLNLEVRDGALVVRKVE